MEDVCGSSIVTHTYSLATNSINLVLPAVGGLINLKYVSICELSYRTDLLSRIQVCCLQFCARTAYSPILSETD